MQAIKIYAVANRLRHGDALFKRQFFEPFYLLGVELDLSSDHGDVGSGFRVQGARTVITLGIHHDVTIPKIF